MAEPDGRHTTTAAKIEAAFAEAIARVRSAPDEPSPEESSREEIAAHFTKRAADYRRNLPIIEAVIAVFTETLGPDRAPPLSSFAEVTEIGRLAETILHFRSARRVPLYNPRETQAMRRAIRDLSRAVPRLLSKTERLAGGTDREISRHLALLRTLSAAIEPFEELAHSRADQRSFVQHAAIRAISAQVRAVFARQGLTASFAHEETDAVRVVKRLLSLCDIHASDGAIIEVMRAPRGNAGKFF